MEAVDPAEAGSFEAPWGAAQSTALQLPERVFGPYAAHIPATPLSM